MVGRSVENKQKKLNNTLDVVNDRKIDNVDKNTNFASVLNTDNTTHAMKKKRIPYNKLFSGKTYYTKDKSLSDDKFDNNNKNSDVSKELELKMKKYNNYSDENKFIGDTTVKASIKSGSKAFKTSSKKKQKKHSLKKISKSKKKSKSKVSEPEEMTIKLF